VQAILLPITDRVHAYAQEVARLLWDADLRVEVDTRQETLRYKIREAQGQKIPYMVIMGDREAADRTLAPRLRDGTELKGVHLEAFIQRLQEESRTPSPGFAPVSPKGSKIGDEPIQIDVRGGGIAGIGPMGPQ